ncbi:MAG: pilus assembly protein [Proteobacteria bacterium]|nr:pilus assembly protein [Pseudomonadota bacterium]
MKSRILTMSRERSGSRQSMAGQSLAEFLIVIPVMLLLTLGVLQFALFFMAKSTLDQAAISGAREGIVNNGSVCSIRAGVVKGLVPLYQTGNMNRDIGGYGASLVNAWTKTTLGAIGSLDSVAIDVVNPTRASFKDFATNNNVLQDGTPITAIPNARLLYRSTAAGTQSQQSIQDANILSIRVNYCDPVIVPPVRWVTGLMTGSGSDAAFGTACYAAGGIPIQSYANLLMQSPALQSAVYGSAASGCKNPFGP